MATFTSVTELKKMAPAELMKERDELAIQAAKMRLAIELGKEKNHAHYRRMRRQIARTETVLGESKRKSLKESAPKATISAPKSEQKAAATQKKAPKKQASASAS